MPFLSVISCAKRYAITKFWIKIILILDLFGSANLSIKSSTFRNDHLGFFIIENMKTDIEI
ncbi:hypothetical protein DS891_14595 [Pseudoalteromonas sp. JC28]|nr:hypothetical protein [Pseudoalteromonas sp. JC28]